jgi:hypothetical protein
MEPITAKKWTLDHYDQYGLGLKDRSEMVALLNILQAADETLESLHECVFNGHREFMDIFHSDYRGWESDMDLYKTILEFNRFYTEREFIEYMLERWADLKEDGYEDPAAEIHTWTYDGEISDTKVYKTEDGYVVRVWY